MKQFVFGFLSGYALCWLAARRTAPAEQLDNIKKGGDNAGKVVFLNPISFDEKFKNAEKIDDILEK